MLTNDDMAIAKGESKQYGCKDQENINSSSHGMRHGLRQHI